MQSQHGMSINQACQLVSVSKTAYYYRPKKPADDELIKCHLLGLAERHKRWGFDKMMLQIKTEKKPWNHKRVYRIYSELHLNIRVKPRKRLPKGEARALLQPLVMNHCWSIDFMSDALCDGRRFRTFNVIDDYNREALLIEPSFTLPAHRVTQLLDQLAMTRGYPTTIRIDHGPEFESHLFKEWAKARGIILCYIQPGKPAQNGFIERFNRTYREDILDMHLFTDIAEVKRITRQWIEIYNQERPHESLAGLAPIPFVHYRLARGQHIGENSISN